MERKAVILRCLPIFDEVAEMYLSERRHLKASTLRSYHDKLRAYLLPAFAGKPFESIDGHSIALFQSELAQRAAPRTVNNVMTFFRAISAWACRRKLCAVDVCADADIRSIKEQPTEIDPLDRQEIDRVLLCIKPLYRQFFQLLAWTGARPSELMALRWRDIDFTKGELHINKARVRGVEGSPKTRTSSRHIPLFTPARAALELQKPFSFSDENNYVFVTEDGTPMNKHYDLMWSRACDRAGVRHRPCYQLRHSFASMLLLAGESAGYVGKLLGHSSLEITFRHYARYMPDAQRDGKRIEAAITQHYSVPRDVGEAVFYKAPTIPQFHVDPIDRFLAERTIRQPDLRMFAHVLHQEYVNWCHENQLVPVVANVFGRRMTARGFSAAKLGRGRYKYTGIGLLGSATPSGVSP